MYKHCCNWTKLRTFLVDSINFWPVSYVVQQDGHLHNCNHNLHSHNVGHFYFYNNFRQKWINFHNFSPLSSERICGESLYQNYYLFSNLSICCRMTSWKVSIQLYSFTFILARIICFMRGGICFVSFYLLTYFFFLILMSLSHYYNIFCCIIQTFQLWR